ncbi:hypothetical protein [Pedobacter punctiformis]|uniref:Uncharacterized protein n=1 Tax=Pedobacter punctiformis TaxID=3004097 RepID=A0ABT4LA21_9SPHI|nr:hypothetical protein [Pedobacter sp. HCMS5-2]MCZ4244770.1 hypothetical protein [Pedobacter sp. HCMS5-2]
MKILILILILFGLGCKQKVDKQTFSKNKINSSNNVSKNTKVSTAKPKDEEPKAIEEKDISLGSVKGKSIKYDRISYSYDDVYTTIYIKNGNKKLVLLTYDYDGYHPDNIKVVYLSGHPFIYITSIHSHGHFRGQLYALDLSAGKANLVDGNKIRSSARVIRSYKEDNIEFRNENGLLLDKNNNITSEDYYKGKEGGNYTYKCYFKLIKIKNNTYILKLIKANMTPDIN